MSGLRVRKKEASRRKIIQAAEDLFSAKGIAATTMDEVAAAAEVSVATVYNYFGTKTALVLAGVEDDTDTMIEQGSAVLGDPGEDPVRAVQKLFGIYLGHLTAWDRHLLGEALTAMFQPGGDQLATGLAQADQRLLAQLTDLVEHFHDGGLLRRETTPSDAALLLFSAMVTHLFLYLSLDQSTAPELQAQVDRQVELAFTGLARGKAT